MISIKNDSDDLLIILDKRESIDLELKLNVTKYGLEWKHIGDYLYNYGVDKYDDDCEFMKVNEPGIDEVEWERAIADDLEYSQSIGTVTVDIYVADLNELEHFLYKPIHETIFRQNIHLDIKDDKFLIVVTLDEQYTIHEVYLELENNGIKNHKSLGWDTYDESVLNIINYYLETGMTLQCYQ